MFPHHFSDEGSIVPEALSRDLQVPAGSRVPVLLRYQPTDGYLKSTAGFRRKRIIPFQAASCLVCFTVIRADRKDTDIWIHRRICVFSLQDNGIRSCAVNLIMLVYQICTEHRVATLIFLGLVANFNRIQNSRGFFICILRRIRLNLAFERFRFPHRNRNCVFQIRCKKPACFRLFFGEYLPRHTLAASAVLSSRVHLHRVEPEPLTAKQAFRFRQQISRITLHLVMREEIDQSPFIRKEEIFFWFP